MIDDAGIALEAKTIEDVDIETDAYPGDDVVTVGFRDSKSLLAGKILLSPQQAAQLAQSLTDDLEWMGYDAKRLAFETDMNTDDPQTSEAENAHP